MIEPVVVDDSKGLSMSPDDAGDAPGDVGNGVAPPVTAEYGEGSAALGPARTRTFDHASAEPSSFATTSLGPAQDLTAAGAPGVPGFDLLEPLGEGGMGVVWKARQVKLNRLVALKMVLGDHRAGSKDLIRFLAEAEAVAAVKHPHVVQVYDYGEANGRPFLAMEYLSGGSLSDRLKRSGLHDPKAAAELVATLAGAVHAAHDLGIVHRDLKPGNVLYDEHGQPKVTDFGLAKRAGGSDLTATQAVMGTPAYMAPEQARGDTKFVGPQADVYSLGVILYEFLTGSRPFEAPDQLALLRKVAEDEPERPSKKAPGLPRDLELICLKSLAKDPAERYPTAGALAKDLSRFAAGEPVSVRAAGVAERAAKWARRKPTLAAACMLGLLAALLGGLGGAAVWQWRVAARARDAAKLAQGEAETAREQLAAVEYGRTIQMAHQQWRDDNVVAALASLESTQPDLRGWEWRYVNRLLHSDLFTVKGVSSASFSPDGSRIVTGGVDGSRPAIGGDVGTGTATVWDAKSGAEIFTLKGHTRYIYSASFSPDGSRVLTRGFENTAKVWDAESGAELFTLKGNAGGVLAASFSPDGSRIVTGGDGTATVWDAKSGAAIFTLKGHTDRFVTASFSPDGSQVLAAGFAKTAKVWDAKSGAELLAIKGHNGGFLNASFNPSGSRIVTWRHRWSGVDDGTVTVWDAKSGAEIVAIKSHDGYVGSVAFSPDGSQLVIIDARGTAKVCDAKTGAEILSLQGRTGSFQSASFSPDGSRVVTGSSDKMARVWDAKSGAEILTLKGHTGGISSASFSPDGSRVLTEGGGAAKVWDPTRIAEVLTLKGHTNAVIAVACSPDGSRIVTGSEDKTAKLWDAMSGAELLTFKGYPGAVTWVSFSADGSRVVSASGYQTVKVWDAKSGAEVPTLKEHTDSVPQGETYFSPDGSRFATFVPGYGNGTVQIWDAKRSAVILTLKGHTEAVRSVSFSADGSRILTASADRTAKVWDAKSGAEVLTLTGHGGEVKCASFSADGSRVVTGSVDGTAKVWDAGPITPQARPQK
jgi:WD40 repeat protein/tRNA A-37 threonylcarbamoyl transferase component Bud32